MKKKLIGMSVIAAAMTAAMSMTAFAGWTETRDGWVYYNDDGSQVWSGWFTDPADGSMYYIDPDGYMMTETRVNGYWLGADGRRVEKTEAEIASEAARAEREASKPTPAGSAKAATEAANAAKSATAAATTTRSAYQAEMKVFMDKYYIETAKELTNENLKSSTTKDTTETTYRFNLDGYGNVISSSLWTVAVKKSVNYKPEAFEISYDRAAMGDDEDLDQLDSLFKQLIIAALGDAKGEEIYNGIFEQLGNGIYTFDTSGNTDSGNYFTLSCGSGIVTIQVTCSETAEAEEAAEEEAAAAETDTDTTANTSSVITAGESADENQDDFEDSSYVEENEDVGEA